MLIDIHEPSEALSLIGPSISTAKVIALNEAGWADYKWDCEDGSAVHVERKQWGEIFSGMDKVEDQLRRHMKGQPDAKLCLLIEGMAIPTFSGSVMLRGTNNDKVYVAGHSTSIRFSQVYAWLYQISKYVQLYQTSNYTATCQCLVAMYKGDQKADDDHTTFKRHYKEVKFHPNPQVTQLMGLAPGIGEKRAEALVYRFTTVYNLCNASIEELAQVPGIGMTLAKTLLQRIGRPDV